MSTIVTYDFDKVKNFMQRVEGSYFSTLTQALTFEDWKCMAYPNMFKNPGSFKVVPYKYGTVINVAPSAVEMLNIISMHRAELQDIELNQPPEKQDYLKTMLFKKILKPVLSFTIDKPLTVKGTLDGKEIDVPVWFNTTLKSINVRLGFDKLDSAKPGAIPLSDLPVHMMLGGTTGSGKSVALNDIVCSLLLEYPPWELALILADFKIVELSRYANRIPTPHVKIVAATGSTEFVLSTFNYAIAEMNARQEVFTACGVQNIKDFREKYDLCMPRMLILADEFVQMYKNIEVAEQAGNDNAGEQKQLINSVISAIARLGRSQGIHMLLSSQDMEGVLDEQTAGQFGAGACLAATGSISNQLIGNPAGSTLHGKGKAYVNLNKVSKNAAENILVRVPYIESEISEEDASRGKLSYLQELLKQMYDLANDIGYKSEPYYYNENDTIPRKMLYDAFADCKEYMANPDEGSDVANDIYRRQVFAKVPLGKEVMYTQEKAASMTLRFKKYHNLVIHADDELLKIYMCKLVGEMLSSFANRYVIASADEVLFSRTNLKESCKTWGIDCDTDLTGVFPNRYIRMVDSRLELLNIQKFLSTKNETGAWDPVLVLEYIYNAYNSKVKPPLSRLVDLAKERNFNINTEAVAKDLCTALADLGDEERMFYKNILAAYSKYYNVFKRLTNNFSEILCAGSFEKIVIWWLGADLFEKDFDMISQITGFLSRCCQVGIFTVIVPSLDCSTLTKFTDCCNFILEGCSKQFFLDVGLPRKININKNSFQMHDRELRTNKIVRLYS